VITLWASSKLLVVVGGNQHLVRSYNRGRGKFVVNRSSGGRLVSAQQGRATVLVRHDDPAAAVMRASLEGVERKVRWADMHFKALCSGAKSGLTEPWTVINVPKVHTL